MTVTIETHKISVLGSGCVVVPLAFDLGKPSRELNFGINIQNFSDVFCALPANVTVNATAQTAINKVETEPVFAKPLFESRCGLYLLNLLRSRQ